MPEPSSNPTLTDRLRHLLSSFLPGIFLLGYCIGTGSVTAMAKAGADYGMALLWTVLLSCYFTYFLIDLYGKFTIVTGLTALEAFKKYIHPAVSIFFIVALTMNVSGSVVGVMGIVSDVCYEWSKTLVKGGIPPLYFALFFVSLVFLLFLDGRIHFFQQVLTWLVALMSLCFLVNFFLLTPPLTEIMKGFIPQIPATGSGETAFLVIASMVGTTVFSGLFIMRATLVKEAGWTLQDLKTQRRDAIFSALMMFVISASIMASAAGALYTRKITLDHVSEMITLLEPLSGSMGVTIFTIGLIAAGVSSQFPNVMLLPWLLNDYHQREHHMRRNAYRIMVFFISLLGLIVPIFHARPIAVMVASQAFGALILPATVGCIFYLGNQRSLMGTHVFSFLTNAVLLGILIFSLVMSYMGITGLVNTWLIA